MAENDDMRVDGQDEPILDNSLSDDLSTMYDDIMAQDDVVDPELDQDNDSVDEVVESADDPTGDEVPGEEEIDPVLVNRAREIGWDDDIITDLASRNPEAFTKMFTVSVQPPASEPVVTPQVTPEAPVSAETADPETVEARIARLEQQAVEVEQQRMQHLKEQAEAFDRQVDSVFDKLKDECPKVGSNDSLTDTELAVRKEIFEIASVLKEGSLEDKLSKAVRAYNGMYGNPEDSLRKKLYKRREVFSPRPGGKKSKEQFASDDERAMHALEEKMRELGID